MKKSLYDPTLLARKNLIIEALRCGIGLQEVLEGLNLKWGTVSAWKRWDKRFRRRFNRAMSFGVPKQRTLRSFENFAKLCSVCEPPSAIKMLMDARARARACAGGRADACKV